MIVNNEFLKNILQIWEYFSINFFNFLIFSLPIKNSF